MTGFRCSFFRFARDLLLAGSALAPGVAFLTPFAALDRKFVVHGRRLVLRGDVIGIPDGRPWLGRLGLTCRFNFAVGIELSPSHPTGPAQDRAMAKLAGNISL